MKRTKPPKYDVDLVRSAARTRWRGIANAIGIDDSFLTGQHGPCPKCQGDDRWRVFDDFNETGGAICNQCGRDLGDGFELVRWYLGLKFGDSLAKVAEYLGIEPTAAGAQRKSKKDADPAEHLKFLDWHEGLAATWCVLHKPGITPAAMVAAGCRRARYRDQFTVFALPVWGHQLMAADPVGWCLYNVAGGTLPKFTPDKQVKQVKTKLTYGSKPGIIGPVDRLAESRFVWKVEGPTDLLALLSLDMPSDTTAITNANGAGEKPAPWMLQLFADKTARVLHDADEAGEKGALGYKEKSGKHRAGWVELIATRATDCRHVRLPYPIREKGSKEPNDLRDWINEGHVYGDAEKLAEATQTAESNPEDPGTVKMVADGITLTATFAQDAGGRLYRYCDGTYKPRAEEFIKREVKRQVHILEITQKWSSRLGSEVCEYIRIDAALLWDRPPLDVVNVKNGLLKISTRELDPHSPDFLSPIQLPVFYDPAAGCPRWERFVSETFPEDATDLAWEVPAWLMVPDTSIQKAVLLTGEGANGKSRYLAGVQAFLGAENACGLSLHRMESDRFCVARMIGKLANICPDLPSEHLTSTSVFKALTGGDTLLAELKFRDTFEIRPFARLVFSANHPPQSHDGSHGFFRRWIVIPFGRTFSDAEQIDSNQLDAMLADPRELSGLLNKTLAARAQIDRRRGLSQPPSVVEAGSEFRAVTDPLAVWLDRNTTEEPKAQVAKSSLHAAYNDSAAKAGRPAMSANAFGRAIKRMRPSLEDAQRTIGGKLVWAYVGIGLADSRDSLDPPYLFSTHESGSEAAEENGREGARSSEQIGAERVNHVNGANGHCEHRYVLADGGDGRTKEVCERCGKFRGYVRTEAGAA